MANPPLWPDQVFPTLNFLIRRHYRDMKCSDDGTIEELIRINRAEIVQILYAAQCEPACVIRKHGGIFDTDGNK
jgi:hypothetical protein